MALPTDQERMRLVTALHSPSSTPMGMRPRTTTPPTSPAKTTLQQEARLLLHLAWPTIVTQIGFVWANFLASSHIGKTYGYLYLDGFALSNLTGNLCTLSILSGLFSASETLSPQAYGAGNRREVGLVAMRGMVGSVCLMVPINVLVLPMMETLLMHMGQDALVARYASQFYGIWIYTLPFYTLYMATWNFLAAQNILMPVVGVAVASMVILPVALNLCTTLGGVYGASVAIVVYQAFQALSLIAYLVYRQPHQADTWPGLSAWREVIRWKSFRHYMVCCRFLSRLANAFF
jgi:multidrug resistance protein, MATE family